MRLTATGTDDGGSTVAFLSHCISQERFVAIPLSQSQTRRATRWLVTNFGTQFGEAIAGTPFGLEVLCGIACKEIASMWLPWIGLGLKPSEILARAIGDASGDVPGTSRRAFPRNTAAFRAAFGDEFAEMLIAEANISRALRNMGPKPWVYKGYGIFQYDLQHVQTDTAFFRERQWHRVEPCLERAVRELLRKLERTGELWTAVKAYNGSGPAADAYRDDVKVLTAWAKDEINLLMPASSRSSGMTPRHRTVSSKRRKTTAREQAAVRALSLHVGLNAVSPAHYAGWSGELVACEFDAKDMAALAKAQGMKPAVLLTRRATRAAVLQAVESAAHILQSGDLFFLTYSGHGGQMPDVTGEEPDKNDETWCLYDGEVIGDELLDALAGFRAGVRVLVLADSCHSGSVLRARAPAVAGGTGRSKMMPPSVAMRTYTMHRAFYDGLQNRILERASRNRTADPDAVAQLHVLGSARLTAIASNVKASVIIISGCQDNQTSLDGDHSGTFTEQLLRVWNNGRFNPEHGTYVNLHATITAGMPSTQTPNFFTLGPVATFARQRPFSV